MARRYLFLCPDRRTASGGIAVIYDTVASLRRDGYDAFVLHNSPSAQYPNHLEAPPRLYTHDWYRVLYRHTSARHRLRGSWRMLRERWQGGAIKGLALRDDDMIVTPEYMMAEVMEAFPRNDLTVFLQNPFSFQTAFMKGLKRGHDIRTRAQHFIGVSAVCLDQLDLLGIANGHHLPVSMHPEDFPFRVEKDALITYMPRKRANEAKLIVAALENRPELAGYQVEALDGVPRAQISEQLQRSRFFISLQKEESIGFPAAEAMAAGCITIGYTGLGGREYFDTTTGVPVPEDDTAGLVQAVLATVREYETDPTRLDALRRHASAEINRRYTRAGFDTALLEIWHKIDG